MIKGIQTSHFHSAFHFFLADRNQFDGLEEIVAEEMVELFFNDQPFFICHFRESMKQILMYYLPTIAYTSIQQREEYIIRNKI